MGQVKLEKPEDPQVFCSHTEMRDPASLVEHPRNYNTHPAEQIRLLAKIIKHQGWRNPITVSKRSGYVVKGHGRLAAALQLGCSEVPVDVQEYKDEASEVADMIADNRIAELAEADQDVLKSLLTDELFDGFDLDLTGFDSKSITFGDSEEDEEVSEIRDEENISFSDELLPTHNYVVLYFDNEIDWLNAKTHFEIGQKYAQRTTGQPWSKGVGRVINGANYLTKISEDNL